MKFFSAFGRSVLVPACVLSLALAASSPSGAADDLKVAKDTIRISVTQLACFGGDDGCKGSDLVMYPEFSCQIYGNMPSGSIAWVEFRAAGKKPLRMDCYAEETWGAQNRWNIGAGDKSSSKTGIVFPGKIPTGTIDFSIGVRNELMETNAVIYEGTFRYDKRLISAGDESSAEVYVVDDWRLPIGYLYMNSERGLHVVTWYRGRPGGVKTYLFKDGKEVANNEGCGIGSFDDFDPNMRSWWEVDCELIGVYGNADDAKNGYEPNYDLSANPGDYEIKCLAAGKLARIVKFTVKPDGSFDNGIAAANELGSNRVIVPVEVRLDVPVWDKAAYRTEAYYGHPLTGFTAPQ